MVQFYSPKLTCLIGLIKLHWPTSSTKTSSTFYKPTIRASIGICYHFSSCDMYRISSCLIFYLWKFYGNSQWVSWTWLIFPIRSSFVICHPRYCYCCPISTWKFSYSRIRSHFSTADKCQCLCRWFLQSLTKLVHLHTSLAHKYPCYQFIIPTQWKIDIYLKDYIYVKS